MEVGGIGGNDTECEGGEGEENECLLSPDRRDVEEGSI
jgi:hypothetical protein